MSVYIPMALVATLCAFLAQLQQQKCRAFVAQNGAAPLSAQRRYKYAFLALAIASAIPYLVVSGIRWDVGTDYFGVYVYMFEGIVVRGEPPSFTGIEPGYWAVNKLVWACGQGLVWLMTVTTAITLLFFFLGFYRGSKLPWLSVWLFAGARHFFISMNGIRQYMGLAFVFFGFTFVREKHSFWKYALCVLAGTLFHVSCIVLLPLYFLKYLRVNPFVGAGLLGGVFLARSQILDLIWHILLQVKPFKHYLLANPANAPMTYPEKLLLNLPIFLLAAWFYFRDDNRNDPQFRFLFNMELLLLAVVLLRNIIPEADRFCWSLETAQLLFIPHLIMLEKNKKLRWVWGAVMVGGYAVFTWWEIVTCLNHGVIPYRCFLNPEIAFF